VVKNMELLKMISENTSDPHKLMIVLNKCDSIVVTELNTTFSDKNEHDKFKQYAEFLKLNGYDDVFPLCAKNSSRISAGDNGALSDEYEKECYENEKLHCDSATLLIRSGFHKIVSSINNFLNGNKNRLINKHVLLEFFDSDEEHNLKSFTSLLNRMQKMSTGEEQHVANSLKEMVRTYLMSINGEIDLDSDLESTKKELHELNQKYSDIFNAQLDTENSFEIMLDEIETKHLLRQVENGWYINGMIKLFNKSMLTHDIFTKSLSKYVDEDTVLDVVNGISLMTSHDPEYLYDVLNVFVQKHMIYIVPFKYNNISDPMLDYIRGKLLESNCNVSNFDINFSQYTKARELFDSLNMLFLELKTKNYDDSFEENQNTSKHNEIGSLSERDVPCDPVFETYNEEPIVERSNNNAIKRCNNAVQHTNKKKNNKRKY
jgi:hypothetical protein